MGSPLSAGGADFYGASREEHVLGSTPWRTRRDLRKSYIGFRWMDDAAHVIDLNAPVGVLRVARRLTHRGTYGEGLQLLRTTVFEAFGFRWNVDYGRVEV